MKHSLQQTLNKLCEFLNKSLTTDQMQALMNHLQFENMKNNPAINPDHLKEAVQNNRPGSEYTFVRRGVTGSHKDEMPTEYIDKFNEITKKRFMGLDLYQSQ